MTAELTDERLAELRERLKAWRRRPEIAQRVVDDLDDCLCELQAYRAKRETHVWVPRVLLPEYREAMNAVCLAYVPYQGWNWIWNAIVETAIAAVEKDCAPLAASDGNPP